MKMYLDLHIIQNSSKLCKMKIKEKMIKDNKKDNWIFQLENKIIRLGH